MVEGKFISGQEDLSEILRIREEVFGKEQAVQNRTDMPDDKCMHVIGYDQGRAVSEILRENGFENVTVIRDLAGLDRVVAGRRK